MSTIRIVVDNQTRHNLVTEHGFAVMIDTNAGLESATDPSCTPAAGHAGRRGERLLLDTGAGRALMSNLTALGIEPASISRLVLSHGHDDHTGGLAELLAASLTMPVYAGPGVLQDHFSCHCDRPVRELSMPTECRRAYAGARVHELKCFTQICPGVLATGPIPRLSGEDCGGPFFLDAAGAFPDNIPDDQAVLLTVGVLVTGCCHSGIINTVEHCRRWAPQVAIHTIIGGLHLVHADEQRLERTAAYLHALGLRRVVACHCTGEAAVARLRDRLSCEVLAGASGDVYEC